MQSFENVSLNPAANIYENGKCVSHTFHTSDGARKSAGVIFPGTFNFGTGEPELMELFQGSCRVRLKGESEWKSYKKGESFTAPGNSSFDIEVTDTLHYVCHYG